jgi:hypothetical protein
VIRHLAAFAFYLALAVGTTWPMARHLATAVPDFGDPLLNAWIVDWVCHALTHAPLELFHAPIYHPAPNVLAFSENMVGIALAVLPFHLAGLPSLAVSNIATLLGLAFSGYGAFALARVVTRSTSAALIAGVVHAFASYRIAHVQHLHIVWSGWLPLLLAAILVYWREPRTRNALFLGAVFFMNGLTTIHWLLFGGVALVLTIGFLQFAEPRDRTVWLRLLATLAIASLLLLPFLIPYQTVANEYGARRTTGEARLMSAEPVHWLVGSSRNLLYGGLFEKWRVHEKELFPGVVAVVLALVGLWVSRPLTLALSPLRRERGRGLDVAILVFFVLTLLVAYFGRVKIGGLSFAGADVPAVITTVLVLIRIAPWVRVKWMEASAALLWVVIGFLGSLGWNFFLHPFLFRVVTPFRATRVPARWAAIAYVGIAVLAAIGAAKLNPKNRRAIAAVLIALAVVDVASRVRWHHVPPLAPIYASARGAASLLEVPLTGDGIPFLYLHAQTQHRVPLVNGTSGWETPAHEQLRKLERELRYPEGFVRDAELLLVHEALLRDEQRAALAPLLARLQLVRREGSDALFRIPRGPAGTASVPRAALPR